MKIKTTTTIALLAILLTAPMISAALGKPNALGPLTQVRNASVIISPTTVESAATDNYVITITNSQLSTKEIGSAAVLIPDVFTIIGTITVSSPWTGVTSTDGNGNNKIQLVGETPAGGNKLTAGQSITISFSASAPTVTEDTIYEWATTCYSGTDWTDVNFAVDLQPTVTVKAPAIIGPTETTYQYEGAYAFNEAYATPFTDFGFGNWGWTNGQLTSTETPYTFQLIAGAGQNILEKGTDVGTVSATYHADGSLDWSITMNDGNVLHDQNDNVVVQIYVGNAPLPFFKGDPTVSPGHYGNNYGSNSGTITGLSGNFYMIVHAEVGIPQ